MFATALCPRRLVSKLLELKWMTPLYALAKDVRDNCCVSHLDVLKRRDHKLWKLCPSHIRCMKAKDATSLWKKKVLSHFNLLTYVSIQNTMYFEYISNKEISIEQLFNSIMQKNGLFSSQNLVIYLNDLKAQDKINCIIIYSNNLRTLRKISILIIYLH